jgi:ubiquinone/menaquinone biosynthesis C-methylase UbiE
LKFPEPIKISFAFRLGATYNGIFLKPMAESIKNVRFTHILAQANMLSDKIRMQAYSKAIRSIVKTGDTVCDIGTGSGILAFLCARAGARKVYAIEKGQIIEEARQLSLANNLESKIRFIKGDSLSIKLPEKVDCIITETIGFFGIEENIALVLSDAKKRFLKPGGKIIPECLNLYLTPFESTKIWDEIAGNWERNFYGFDYSAVLKDATSRRYIKDLSKGIRPLSAPKPIHSYDFHSTVNIPSIFSGKFKLMRQGILHGLAGHFDAILGGANKLSSSLFKPKTHWNHTFFPLAKPVAVKTNDLFSYKLIPIKWQNNHYWQWEVSVERNGETIYKTTNSDFHPSSDSLRTATDSYKPSLSNSGRIALEVLKLANGSYSMISIANAIHKKYARTIKTLDEATRIAVSILQGRIK